MSSSGEVTFVSPTEGAPGPSFEVYSKTSIAPERSRIFPDDPAPHAMAIDASGSVILVGGFANSGESVAVSFGGPSIAMNGNGYYLIKLNSDWDYLFGLGVAMTDNVQVTAVATDADNHIYVALNLANEFGMVGPQIVAYDEQLRELYRTPVEPLGQDAAITSLTVSASGELLVTGNFVGQLRFGNHLLFASTNLSSSTRNLDGWVARCNAATGACDYVVPVGGPLSDQVTGYAQDSLGGLRAFATLTGPVVALGAKIAASDFGSPILFGMDGATGASWSTALGDWGVADTLALAKDGTSYVSGRTMIRDNTGATNQQVFVAEVARDGTISSYYPIASLAQSKTVIAAGAERLIWLAWVAPVTNASRLTFDSVTLMRLESK
jgi:hypothetical protein